MLPDEDERALIFEPTRQVLSFEEQAIESGHGALTWFWDRLPGAERFIMSAVAHVSNEVA